MIDLKSHLAKLGYEFTEIKNGIILIENFLTEQDVLPMWEIINNATEEDWKEDYRKSQKELARRKFNSDDVDLLISKGLMEYTYDWDDKAIAIPPEDTVRLNKKMSELFSFDKSLWYGYIDTIQRQYEGSELKEHVDSHGDPDILYAVIGYLNDDYVGGELFFPNMGLEIKPPKNSIIIFPDGEQYKHGVRAPGKGPMRYALPTFVRDISNSPDFLPE